MMQQRDEHRQPWFAALVWALAFAGFLIELALPRLIHSSFDGAWAAVSGESLSSSAFSVHDIVSTVGPFSPIYTGYFVKSVYPAQFILSVVVAASFAWACVRIFRVPSGSFRNAGEIVAIVATIFVLQVFVIGFASRDVLLHVVGLYVGMGYVMAARGRWHDSAFAMSGAIALSIMCLAKWSALASAGVALGFIDIWRVFIERRAPIAIITFATVMILFLVSAGFSLAGLPGWLRLNGDIIGGYSSAMVLAGPAFEVFLFVALGATLVASLFMKRTWIALHDFSLPQRLAVTFMYAGFLFGIFKAGFVRADLHTLISWGCFAATIPPLGGLRLGLRQTHAKGRVASLTATVAAIGLMFGMASYKSSNGIQELPRTIVDRFYSKMTSFASLVEDPRGWLEEMDRRQNDAYGDAAKQMPLPHVKGSIDSIPTIQAAIIAHRLDYRPRPSFQQYSTYGPALIAANKAFYRSINRPEYVLFFPEAIDNWYPNLAEGALWEELFRYYEPSSRFRDLLLLRRRPSELGPILTTIGVRTGKLGDTFDLSGVPDTVFAKIRVRETLVGTLKRLLFRASSIFIRIRYTDGRERVFKLIPSIAAEGFLLSPTVETGTDFAALALGMRGVLKKIRSIAVESPGMLSLNYASELTLELFAVDTKGFKPNDDNGTLTQEVALRAGLPRLAAASDRHLGEEALRFIPEGLLAHAPMRISVPVTAPANSVTVRFGIVDGAWQAPTGTPGLCFRVSRRRPQAREEVLIDKCLQPKTNQQDRGEHTASTRTELVPGDTVIVETACMATCSYGWSYWSGFSINSQ